MTTIQEIYQEGDKFAYEPHRSIALFSLILKHLEVAERQLKLRRYRRMFEIHARIDDVYDGATRCGGGEQKSRQRS